MLTRLYIVEILNPVGSSMLTMLYSGNPKPNWLKHAHDAHSGNPKPNWLKHAHMLGSSFCLEVFSALDIIG